MLAIVALGNQPTMNISINPIAISHHSGLET
ncbi:hypothetical protein TRIP_B350436 [uncultured Desulfatiglans sp.]|uniref:Uncharacterized protein n=1 Tax=Uncultured Desulfatiglans sp. TaxID=1748965 RepID=A0A653ABW0_UNCDX|nr:hypothetical protein TRIP_B350436 [uncultured Desulfatiglans sp.]